MKHKATLLLPLLLGMFSCSVDPVQKPDGLDGSQVAPAPESAAPGIIMVKLDAEIADDPEAVDLSFLGDYTITRSLPEGGRFDAQAVMNPGIQGREYQQGPQSGFDNVKAYVRWRDGYACTSCGNRGEGVRLEVHHLRRRADGGSDRPDNLVTLCHECHRRHHEEGMPLKAKAPALMRDMSAMNAVRRRIIDGLREVFPSVRETWGYVTARSRAAAGLGKSHTDDALAISGNIGAVRTGYVFLWRQVPRHSRRLHEEVPHRGGRRKSKVAAKWIPARRTGTLFRRYDRVRVNGTGAFVAGSTNGYLVVRDIRWKPAAGVKTSISPNKAVLAARQRGGYIIETEKRENNGARSLFDSKGYLCG